MSRSPACERVSPTGALSEDASRSATPAPAITTSAAMRVAIMSGRLGICVPPVVGTYAARTSSPAPVVPALAAGGLDPTGELGPAGIGRQRLERHAINLALDPEHVHEQHRRQQARGQEGEHDPAISAVVAEE